MAAPRCVTFDIHGLAKMFGVMRQELRWSLPGAIAATGPPPVEYGRVGGCQDRPALPA